MGRRTNTAQWLPNQKRWQIKVQKDGQRRTFTSAKPGRTGQRVASQLLNAFGIERPGFLCCTPDGTLNGRPLAAPLV